MSGVGCRGKRGWGKSSLCGTSLRYEGRGCIAGRGIGGQGSGVKKAVSRPLENGKTGANRGDRPPALHSLLSALRSPLFVLCSLLSALCSLLSALCSLLSALCSLLSALCSSPSVSAFHSLLSAFTLRSPLSSALLRPLWLPANRRSVITRLAGPPRPICATWDRQRPSRSGSH